MSGNGQAAHTAHIRATVRLPERWASITASSWSIRWCCAVVPWLPRQIIPDTPIGTSSIPTSAGSSVAFVSHATSDKEIPSMPDDSALLQAAGNVADAALSGLLQQRKTLPAKLFYDAEGCRLFG